MTYESRTAELEAKLAVLNTELTAHLENRLQKYEEYIIGTDITGIPDEDGFLQGREEIEPIKSEIREVETQISSLNEEHEQYQLFCDVIQDKHEIGRLITDYLQNATIFANKRIDILFKN